MRVNYSVKTILRKDKMKKNGTCPLYFSIIINSEQLRIPSGKSILPENWDYEKSCPKGKNLGSLKRVLIKRETEIVNLINKLDLNEETISIQSLKAKLNKKDCKSFYDHFDDFCNKKFDTINEGTQRHYLLLRKQLKEYRPSISLKEMDYSFLNNFFYYLRHNKGVGDSGLAMRRKNLITTFEEFIKLGLVNTNPVKHLPRYKESTRDVFLTKDELLKLTEADLQFGNKTNGLELTRDLFLFSCYSGLRYSDMIDLKRDAIVNNKIILETKKTKRIVEIPLKPEAISILKKYNYKRKKGRIFPFRCNVSVNRDLKLIAMITKISKRLTFHASRHTFGSMLAFNDVQPFYIMKLMGHGDIRMTNRYVNSDSKILGTVMEKVEF